MTTALITGASRGLGYELARALARQGWDLVIDARSAGPLSAAADRLRPLGTGTVTAVPGDISDDRHRGDLVDAAVATGGLDLLVNNASILGPSPQPPIADYPLDVLLDVYEVNALAPLALTQLALPHLRVSRGMVVNVTSDAAVEAYPGWGGYGPAKAALDHWTRILAEEEPGLGVYAVDPGDLRTQLHQQAFPGEDISDRPEPASAVPGFLALLAGRPPSGRHRAADLAGAATAGGGAA